MKTSDTAGWEHFLNNYIEFSELGVSFDFSRMDIPVQFRRQMQPELQKAFQAMRSLESGAIANPDENRMVGHYWLRNPGLAPNQEIRNAIEQTIKRIKQFAASIHDGEIRAAAGPFENLLLIGIGGSALGPQFVADALGSPSLDKLRLYFFDNTDPNGMNRILEAIGQGLKRTLCIVVSKSGGTKETRNGMLVARRAFEASGLSFSAHAVAITQEGSELDNYAISSNWLARFPMWDWVGGRTSQMSAVGLLPAALQGIDIEGLLSGAAKCDELTRSMETNRNPACMLALAWFHSGSGRGERNMVVLPYKDRLQLLSKYLQQLVMESLGKERDLSGEQVNQGITVFGNKGSTDQHSYIQQLRDGKNDFFATFIEVRSDQDELNVLVEGDFSSGDYLQAFLLGTRRALRESGRSSITISVAEVSAFTVGFLIALFERTVGLYASLINVNAYHQPGVEAGKKAAANILRVKLLLHEYLKSNPKEQITFAQLKSAIGAEASADEILYLCNHLAENRRWRVSKIMADEVDDQSFAYE